MYQSWVLTPLFPSAIVSPQTNGRVRSSSLPALDRYPHIASSTCSRTCSACRPSWRRSTTRKSETRRRATFWALFLLRTRPIVGLFVSLPPHGLIPTQSTFPPAFLTISRLSSLVWRVDRVGGKGRVHVRRGTCAHNERKAHPVRSHRYMGDGQHG